MNWRTKLATLFVVQSHNPTWRSSFFGMLCTGLPFIAGLIMDRPIDGMMAAILGMLLMLNDYGGDLRQRLQNQLLMLMALLVGCFFAMIIHVTQHVQSNNYSPIFYILLLALTFFAGWSQGSGKLLEGCTRNIVLALLVVSQLPYIDLTLQLFLLASAVLSLIARYIDHLLAPRAFDSALTPLKENIVKAFHGGHAGWRYASVYSACIVGGLLLGMALHTSKAYWVAVTIMMTMRPDAELNFVRSLQRIAGTVVGVTIAIAVVAVVPDVWWIALIVLLTGFMLPHGLPLNYGLHCTLIALFVLLLYHVAMINYGGDANLFRERIYDVILGCCVALVGNVLAFPGKNNPDKKLSGSDKTTSDGS